MFAYMLFVYVVHLSIL